MECPQTIDNSQTLEALNLNLDNKCDIKGLKKHYPDYHDVI